MLYLEDYLEMIENLPMEMRDRFTEMREMDLQVQNAMDSLEDRVKTFFSKCKPPNSPKPEWKDEHFQQIKQDYGKALEDADEKVQLANQIYELVERYLRKLDMELSKFKMELEADNAGITEVLERRSLELDNPPQALNNHRAEKRKYAATLSNHVDKRVPHEKVMNSVANDVAKEGTLSQRGSNVGSSPASFPTAASQSPALSYSLGHVGARSNAAIAAAASKAIGATLHVPQAQRTARQKLTAEGHMGAGSNAAIAAAASRAIGATLEMQQGRRTASLKASFEAMSRTAELSKDFAFSGAGFRSTGTGETTSSASSSSSEKSSRNKKSGARTTAAPSTPTAPEEPPVAEVAPTEMVVDDPGQAVNWTYDPNEPRYCTCNDVSYGEMVGCDNSDCPIEWFHYGCVGLLQAPKGKWYCPQCTAAMKRRGRK